MSAIHEHTGEDKHVRNRSGYRHHYAFGVAVDTRTGEVAATLNQPNRAALDTGEPFARAQDPDRIIGQLTGMADELCRTCGPVAAIGLTGQMHGMLYVDEQGQAVSPLYTWQDGRGEQPFAGGTYASALSDATGYAMATGFGLTTHFWHVKNARVPERAEALCTIFDYAGHASDGKEDARLCMFPGPPVWAFLIKTPASGMSRRCAASAWTMHFCPK